MCELEPNPEARHSGPYHWFCPKLGKGVDRHRLIVLLVDPLRELDRWKGLSDTPDVAKHHGLGRLFAVGNELDSGLCGGWRGCSVPAVASTDVLVNMKIFFVTKDQQFAVEAPLRCPSC